MLDAGRHHRAARDALCKASDQAFYNTSKFSLRDLKSRGSQQQLKADFEDYLDGFLAERSGHPENFEFRNVLARSRRTDALGTLIEKFLDPEINLSPNPVLNGDGSVKHPGMDNHSMGTVFEELVRRFNEENNEEAGEHWTPRDAVRLMTTLMFRPIADRVKAGSYLLYDCACGTGGMLTVAEETLRKLAARTSRSRHAPLRAGDQPGDVRHLQGRHAAEGRGRERGPHRRRRGVVDALARRVPGPGVRLHARQPALREELEEGPRGDGRQGRDARPALQGDAPGRGTVPRHASSDGQLLFLANMASKMNHKSALGSRIAEVHNGSSLFTGDAGSGESNIRRWLFENDWVEAIIALPLKLFYNTGIATYVWVLSNRRPRRARARCSSSTPRSGSSRCARTSARRAASSRTRTCSGSWPRTTPSQTEQSKIFANEAFGYRKVTVERPLRLHSQLTTKAIESLRFASGDEDVRSALYDELGDALFDDFAKVKAAAREAARRMGRGRWRRRRRGRRRGHEEGAAEKKKKKLLDPKTWERDGRLVDAATKLKKALGDGIFTDHNEFRRKVGDALDKAGIKLGAADLKQLLRAVSWRDDSAPPVIAKVHKPGKATADRCTAGSRRPSTASAASSSTSPTATCATASRCRSSRRAGSRRSSEREVLPYTPDAWVDESKTQIGYEVSFTRHFYKPQRLRTLEEIAADIVATEKEAEGLLEASVACSNPNSKPPCSANCRTSCSNWARASPSSRGNSASAPRARISTSIWFSTTTCSSVSYSSTSRPAN
jgi:type I restriction enzyme M protein